MEKRRREREGVVASRRGVGRSTQKDKALWDMGDRVDNICWYTERREREEAGDCVQTGDGRRWSMKQREAEQK